MGKLRSQVGRVLAELEAVVAGVIAKAPPLAFLARPPYISYVTGAAMAAPLLTILLPLLLLRGTVRATSFRLQSTSACCSLAQLPRWCSDLLLIINVCCLNRQLALVVM